MDKKNYGDHEPLLQCNEKLVEDKDDSVVLDYDCNAAPILSSNSDKWKFKCHRILPWEQFGESHNQSPGMHLLSIS